MNKDQNTRKYLDIPGEKTLVYTFKFNMDLPPPIPQPKTMFIPLDPERYIKPRLTLFHVKRKPVIYTDINLSIPIDEINMRPELFNPAPDAKFEFTDKDRELLEEKLLGKKTPQKPAADATKVKVEPQQDNAKVAANNGKPKTTAPAATKKPEPTSGQKKKEENKKLPLEEYIKKSFDIAKSYDLNSAHPTREGVFIEEVFEIVPDIENIIQKFHVVKTEVATDTLKSKENLLRFDVDVDKKPILGIYSHKPLFERDMEKELKKKKTDFGEGGLDEEVEGEENGENKEDQELANDPLLKNVENFEHMGDYIYSHPKTIGRAKKDFLLNLKKEEAKAYIYQTEPILIKKKKVLFVNKFQEEEDERRGKDNKKSIKLIKKNQDKKDLLLKKRRFEEYKLEHSQYYDDTKEQLQNYREEEDEDELEQIKKKLVKEEEEAMEEEEQVLDDERDIDDVVKEEAMEEEEEVPEARSRDEIEEEKEEERRKSDDDDEEAHFDLDQLGKEEPEVKKEHKEDKEGSDAAQELADFFGEDSEDDDD